jgi:hypothetical protein
VKRPDDDPRLLRRCFAKKGLPLVKEVRARQDEWAYLVGLVVRLKKLKGLTPQERAGVRLALDVISGKRTPYEVRQAADRRNRPYGL